MAKDEQKPQVALAQAPAQAPPREQPPPLGAIGMPRFRRLANVSHIASISGGGAGAPRRLFRCSGFAARGLTPVDVEIPFATPEAPFRAVADPGALRLLREFGGRGRNQLGAGGALLVEYVEQRHDAVIAEHAAKARHLIENPPDYVPPPVVSQFQLDADLAEAGGGYDASYTLEVAGEDGRQRLVRTYH